MYKPTLDLIQHSLFARILDCWRITCGRESLVAFAESKPDFETIWKMAKRIVETYACSRLISRAQNKNPEDRDGVFENSSMFIRDALLLFEMCDAVKAGDTGRINGVRRWWTFCFWGAGSFNYGLESLYLDQNLQYEWSEKLVAAFFDNWLLNTKGKHRCWVEADLVQEHVNFWIKV
jgi:hypothetical protein